MARSTSHVFCAAGSLALAAMALPASGCQLILGIGGELPLEERCDGAGCEGWIRTVIGDIYGAGAGVDDQGNVVVAALYSGTLDLGDGVEVTAKGESDVALLKYDATGTLLWTKVMSAPGHQAIQNIDVNRDGYIAVVGRSDANLDLGGAAGTIGAGAFVARLDPDGNTLWATTAQSKLAEPRVAFVDQDSQGNVVVGGNGPDIDFGTGQLDSGDHLSFHVAKLAAASGEVEWARITEAPDKQGLGAVAVDPWDNIVLAGSLESEHLALGGAGGGDLLNETGADAPFVARLGPDGAFIEGAVWATSPTALDLDPNNMAVDSLGAPSVVGVFSQDIQLASGTYGAMDDTSAFVVHDPASGPGEWSRAYTNLEATANAGYIAIDTHDNLVVSGVYTGPLDLGTGPLPKEDDAFLLKLDSEGHLLWVRTFYFGEGAIQAIASGAQDEIALVGAFHDQVDLGDDVVAGSRGLFVTKLGY